MLGFAVTSAAALFTAASLGQVPAAGDVTPQSGWDKLAPLPPGQVPLELRLTAVRNAYPLGQPRGAGSAIGQLHLAAPVAILFELKNTGKAPVELRGTPEPTLTLIGPDGKSATPFDLNHFFVAQRSDHQIAPGETLRLPLVRLAYHVDRRQVGLRWWLPGEYTLHGSWALAIRSTGVATVASTVVKLRVEPGDELPYWRDALADRNADVRRSAADFAKVIQPVPAALVPALTKALEQERETPIRVAMVQALERQGSAAIESVSALLRQLRAADPKVRTAAVVALAHIAPKDKVVADDLLPLLQDQHAPVRRTLAERLGNMLHDERGLIDKQVVTALRRAVATEADETALGYLIRALGKVPDPLVIRDLLPHLENELLTKHRHEAAGALGSVIFWMPRDQRQANDDYGSPVVDAVAALVRLLEKGDPARSTIIYALMQIGPDAAPAVPLLVAEVKKPGKKDDWNSDRLYAVRALGAIGPAAKDAVPALVDHGLRDPNWQLRESAVTALGQIKRHPDLAVPALLKVIPDEREIVTSRAFEALAEFGPDAKQAIPSLRNLTGHRDAAIANAAREALKKIEK